MTLDRIEPNIVVGYVGLETEKHREQIQAFGRMASKLIIRPNVIWWGSMQDFGLPRYFGHDLAKWIRFAVDQGAIGFDFDGNTGNWGTQGLHYYVLARVLWEPKIDVDEVEKDYCRAAYGQGAEPMLRYYDLLEKLSMELNTHEKFDKQHRFWHPEAFAQYYRQENLERLASLIESAKKAIGNADPGALARVKMVEEGIEFTRCTRDLVLALVDVKTWQDWKNYKKQKDVFTQYAKDKLLTSWTFTGLPHNYANLWYSLEAHAEKLVKQRLAKQCPPPPADASPLTADESTVLLLHFDHSPLRDSGPLKMELPDVKMKLTDGQFGQALSCWDISTVDVPLPKPLRRSRAVTVECWLRYDGEGNKLQCVVGHAGRSFLSLPLSAMTRTTY